MESVRIDPLVSPVVQRVVAWHNRHPLAERINPAQVHSIGVVALPFAWRGGELASPAVAESPAPDAAATAAPAEPSAAEATPAPEAVPADPDMTTVTAQPTPPAEPRPAFARSPQRPPRWHPRSLWRALSGGSAVRALFSEDFIAPLSRRRVAAFARQHGVAASPLAADAPERVIAIDAARRGKDDGAAEAYLYVVTAAIAIGERRLRLLLAPGDAGAAVLGTRQWDRGRCAGAGSAVAALVIAAVGTFGWPLPQPAAAQGAAAEPVAIDAAHALRVIDNATVVADEPAAAVATADDPGAAERPTDVEPRRGTIELPLRKPIIDAEAKAQARQAREPLRRAAAARHAPPKVYALVSRPMPQRATSERVAAQLEAMARTRLGGGLRAELMQVSSGWRAVCWPFDSPRDAEKARTALADRGVQTEVIEF